MEVKGGWSLRAYSSLLFIRLCLFFSEKKQKENKGQKIQPSSFSPLFNQLFLLNFLFQRKRKNQKRMTSRGHSSLPFNLLLSLLFFQEKEKQKEKQKRKMRPSFSPLFSFLFFFKKGKKGGAKGRRGVQGIAFSAIFVLFFV